jgi:hypothetical protein
MYREPSVSRSHTPPKDFGFPCGGVYRRGDPGRLTDDGVTITLSGPGWFPQRILAPGGLVGLICLGIVFSIIQPALLRPIADKLATAAGVPLRIYRRTPFGTSGHTLESFDMATVRKARDARPM